MQNLTIPKPQYLEVSDHIFEIKINSLSLTERSDDTIPSKTVNLIKKRLISLLMDTSTASENHSAAPESAARILRIVMSPDDLEDGLESLEASLRYDQERFGPRWAKFYLWSSCLGLFVRQAYKATLVAKLLDGFIARLEK